MATLDELEQQAQSVKNETVEKNNSAFRIGSLLEQLILFLKKFGTWFQEKAETHVFEFSLTTVSKTIIGAINEVFSALKDKADKTDLDSLISSSDLDQTLNQKADKTYVDNELVKKVNTDTLNSYTKSGGSLKTTKDLETEMVQLAGEISGITENSRNIADPSKFKQGYLKTTGVFSTDERMTTTGLIPVEHGKSYYINSEKGAISSTSFLFDSSGNFLRTKKQVWTNAFIPEGDVAFFALNITNNGATIDEIKNSVMISVDERLPYEPPLTIKSDLIANITKLFITSNFGNSRELSASQELVTSLKNILLEVGKNKIDTSTVIEGKYFNTTGSLASFSNGLSVVYQPCKPLTDYSIYSTKGDVFTSLVFFFDKNKTFLSSIAAINDTFTTPENCYYIGRNSNLANISYKELCETIVFKEGAPTGYEVSHSLNSSLLPKSQIARKEVLNVSTVPHLLLIGTSHTEGNGSVRDKSFASYLSAMLDWNVLNYGRSGNNYVKHYNNILAGTVFGGVTPIVDCKNGGICIDFLGSSAENTYFSIGMDGKYSVDNMIRLYSLISSMGFDIICGSYFGDQNQPFGLMQRDVAKKFGFQYASFNNAIAKINNKSYTPFWINGHFASRTVANQFNEVLKNIKLSRPRTALKIFRNRVNYDNLSDYLFDNNYEKMRKWREISISHKYIPEGFENYVDRLDILSSAEGYPGLVRGKDEYVEFKDRGILNIPDKALIQFTLPATSAGIKNVELTLDTDIEKKVYVRRYLDRRLMISSANSKAKFVLAEMPTINVGDIFDDSQNPGISFTVDSVSENTILCTPSSEFQTEGQTNNTLTRVSDGKQFEYKALYAAASEDYFNKVFEEKGDWELIQDSQGVYKINTYGYMDYDRIDILVVGSGQFNFSKIEASYQVINEKTNSEFKTITGNVQDFIGNNILRDNAFSGENWILNAKNGSYKYDGDTDIPGLGVKNHIPPFFRDKTDTILHLKKGDSVKQTVLIANKYLSDKMFRMKLIARYHPDENLDLSQISSITSNTFEFARLEAKIRIKDSGTFYSKTLYVPASFVELEEDFYFDMPNYVDNEIEFTAIDDRVELLYCEVLE